MARKNRASVYDGVYHVTTRIANRAMLLGPDEVKDKLMEWTVSVAAFSGVEVWGFTIMDNHLHLIVHVPPVPGRFWLDPDDEPAAYAFGMRPPECRVPLWRGDRPLAEGDGAGDRRPPLGFMLADDEMLGRLSHLYGDERAGEIGAAWASLRRRGLGGRVDEQKERYCRRMYNLSSFVKSLKERVSVWYNRTYGHAGTLWEGRFYSGVVERRHEVLAVVAAYVAYNPVKAKVAASPSEWKWSSYALAANDAGEDGERCRAMYERMFGRPWEEVHATLESIYADELPSGVTPAELREWFDDYDEDAADGRGASVAPPRTYRASQAIRVSMKVFRSGAYISADFGFVKKVRDFLPKGFPQEGQRSVKRCRAFLWDLPERRAA